MNLKYLIAAIVVLVAFGIGFLLGGWNHRQEYVERLLELNAREKQLEQQEEDMQSRLEQREKEFEGDMANMQQWMEFFGYEEMAAFEDYVEFRPPTPEQSKEDYIKQFKEYREWVKSR